MVQEGWQYKQTEETNSGGKTLVAQTGMLGQGREDNGNSVAVLRSV